MPSDHLLGAHSRPWAKPTVDGPALSSRNPAPNRSNDDDPVKPAITTSYAQKRASVRPERHVRSRRGCCPVLSANSSTLTVLRHVLARSLVLTTWSEENCGAGHGRGLLERTRTSSAAVLRSIRGHAAGFVGQSPGQDTSGAAPASFALVRINQHLHRAVRLRHL